MMASSQRVLVPYRKAERVKPYLEALERAGLTPVVHDVSEPARLKNVAALLLTGGTDVDPRLYGETPHAETDIPDRGRDNNELALLTEALAFDLPVLAICRGIQILNVHQGGTLVQHLGSARHRKDTPDKSIPAHEVDILPDTLLDSLLAEKSIAVNSRHHQAIGQVAPTLRICATDPADGVVEGVYLPAKRWVLGVQWHPEDQVNNNAAARRLFEAFADAISI